MKREWGRPGVPGATYYNREFNMPTGVAIASDGCIFVSDGCGNRCVHKYSNIGEHLMTWGEAGSGPG